MDPMRILNKGNRASLWIRAEMKNLHAISGFVRDWLSGHEAYRKNQEQSYLVELAVIEGCTNVIRHAAVPPSAGTLGVTMKRLNGSVEIMILDRGRPFDPTRVASPAAPDDPGEGGYGIHLIRAIMHQVRYERRGQCWNTLRLTHDLTRAEKPCDGQGYEGGQSPPGGDRCGR